MPQLPDIMNPRNVFKDEALLTDVECDYCGDSVPLEACVCFPLWSLHMWGDQKARWAITCTTAHMTAHLQPEGLA